MIETPLSTMTSKLRDSVLNGELYEDLPAPVLCECQVVTHSGLPERSDRCLIDVDLVGQVDSNQGKAQTIMRRTDRNIGIQCDVVFLNIVIQGQCIRSEQHKSELQTLMRHPYAVFCYQQPNYTNKSE